MGECETYKEERDVLEEMRKIDGCDIEKFGTLDSSEKTIAILGERWRPQTAKQQVDKRRKRLLWIREEKGFYVSCGKNVMSAQMLEASLVGAGTVPRLCLLYTSPSPRD